MGLQPHLLGYDCQAAEKIFNGLESSGRFPFQAAFIK
jgi:hypothetical protein